ncbi:helix-turn-helix domain-containing protein [Serratia nevei]|uniref:helix-turn-helix domain-containing protein n=1 Tax=Serratia TaxID=613 RepID=UPI001A32B28D|nr:MULTISPECIES: helix-turn-helix transcriptional regulator [Serratia]WIJ66799.1 helix-turn-helix domain-containing protein [Serratia nevei]HAT3690506.1 helix-turn-helix transcriptional regulator [Serratia marcescens]
MSIGKKLREIREAEGLTREELSEITGVPVPTMKRYETGRIANVGSDTLTKYTQHPRFSKYSLWLMSDLVAPESGQISPSLSPDGSNNTSDHQKDQKVG